MSDTKLTLAAVGADAGEAKQLAKCRHIIQWLTAHTSIFSKMCRQRPQVVTAAHTLQEFEFDAATNRRPMMSYNDLLVCMEAVKPVKFGAFGGGRSGLPSASGRGKK